jgi:hypothetical protein
MNANVSKADRPTLEPRNIVVQVRHFGGPDGIEVADAPWRPCGGGAPHVRPARVIALRVGETYLRICIAGD